MSSRDFTSLLADVELQLVMHNLDAPSLICLARSSRRTLQVASNAFAWKFTQLRLNSTPRHVVTILPTQLLAHARVSLRFHPTYDPLTAWRMRGPPNRMDPDVEALLQCGLQLHELDASSCRQIRLSHWARILAHPSMQQLRVLRMQKAGESLALNLKTVLLIAGLPHLHTLVAQTWSDLSLWSHLCVGGRALTSLSVADSGLHSCCAEINYICVGLAIACCRLKHLHIDLPCLWGPIFRQFFTSPHTRQIESLALSRFCAHTVESPMTFDTRGRKPVPVADYAAAFSALDSLHTLRLSECKYVSSIVPHLTCAPALRTLIIESSSAPMAAFDESSTAPAAAQLIVLLRSQPQLSCVLCVPHHGLAAVSYYAAELRAQIGDRFSTSISESTNE